MKPQPKHRPMLVRTATAEAEILGTVFNLSTRPDDTLLKVDEGLVKLRRLADGHSINVPAQSSALASLDATKSLDTNFTPPPLTSWRFDFATLMPPLRWRGIWHPSLEGNDGRMMASAYVAARKPDGTIITHYGTSVRTAYLVSPLSLLALDSSVLRLRLRQEREGPLQIMLITNTPEGGFGGNFESRLVAGDHHPASDGWCVVDVPLSRFAPVTIPKASLQKHPTASGSILTSVLISSFRDDTKLALSSFELLAKPSR